MTEQAEKQPFGEAHGLPAPGTRMTAAYRALPETLIPMELIDGVVVYPHWNEDTMTPAPIPDHQDIALNIASVLRVIVQKGGGSVHIALLDVYLTDAVLVQPDVIWRAPESQCIRTDKDFRGTPELVVEVLSPGTAQRDKTDKFALYEQHGAHEYWLVDPRDNLIEVYTRQGTGFRRLGAFKAGQTFQSPVLADAAIAVKEIFSRL